MKKLKILNIITHFIFIAFLIVGGIVEKSYLSFILAFLTLVTMLDTVFEKKDYNKKEVIFNIIFNTILILICGYYFLSLSGLSNKIIDYIIVGMLGIIYIYMILYILFIRKIMEKAHIRKLMK